jgi:hypothetical protein
MTRFIRTALAASCIVAAASTAGAQSSMRGQPRTPFAASDFAHLRWLEGSWIGTAAGQSPLYERFHFTSDSTADITFYRDSAFTQPSGSGRVYLTIGRVYHTYGSGRWGAAHLDSASVFFVPQSNAHNTFEWTYQSPDAWTVVQRSGMAGLEHVVTYHMRRAGR